jgi:light-regulated signal transduction histidine kinase (bacteriophytochrome)
MTQLIEDLLVLSQVTTKEIKHNKVNLSDLANEAINVFKEAEPARPAIIEVESNLIIMGDEQLLKIAVSNLVENSWKYTGKQSSTEIRFGFSKEKLAFYIADNGVGFNMKYADKLFDVFQRLHNASEFTGSGVGLTTVQRVIDRHNGKIWGESEEGNGATFYFSI